MAESRQTAWFLFAHQDDEFGVFWELELLRQQGVRVVAVYLTSGDLQGKPAPHRDAESSGVLQKLGVAQNDVHFLGSRHAIPDGQLVHHLREGYAALLKLAEEIGAPQQLYLLAWEGGHQDHDAAHVIGMQLVKRFGLQQSSLQFPLYTGAGLPGPFFRLFAALPQNGAVLSRRIPVGRRLAFISYTFSYPSQKKTWVGLFPFFCMHYIFFGTQVLQPVSESRIRQSPHAGAVLYERRGFETAERVCALIDIFLQEQDQAARLQPD